MVARRILGWLLLLGVLLCCIYAAFLYLGNGDVMLGDEKLFVILNPGQATLFDSVMVSFSTWGWLGWGFYLFIGVILLVSAVSIAKERPRRGLANLFTVFLGLIVVFLVYLIFTTILTRDRPFLDIALESKAHVLFDDPVAMFPTSSFPSGHAMVGFVIAIPNILIFRSRAIHIISLVFAVFYGYARIYIGVHYPQDVIWGAILGTIIAVMIYLPLERESQKKRGPDYLGYFRQKNREPLWEMKYLK